MLEPDRRKIVELLYQQEMILGQLYQIFTARFAEYADFWTDLAGEGVRHAELIRKLYQAGKKDWVSFREGKIRAQSITTFIEHVKGLAVQAENDEIDFKSAVAHTLDLEKSLLEKNVFSRFEAMDARMKAVLTRLENETRKHAAKARSPMEKIL
ncbi:MAG: hypothetical protein RBR01_02745 [Desulfobacterales bacterium]|jgi:hypothetical protein|nr:hypothetical protein [Desulfobacterales bacterium]MDD3080726.1 hypothetical protein [Desulfobacterales bacterium]MDD3949547.1 hypothetical protein [Desulfobacterales bacterium]MDD4462714.1 hypothetical protein [Desulfobacterales bacterium]MDY0377330.1 hypothetical protein [Desulfobacterales bacterium]